MKRESKSSLDDIVKNIKELSTKIKDLIPFGEVFEVKKFTRASHIILSKDLIGKKVLVLKLPEIEKENNKSKLKKKPN